ncbi:hypothetical protein K490DRAFT_66073 [Saccharata proteae CBS 121410]|uniref:Uncharacterized protein n=1 Tax=Saccharata proteae CBS 121410 TaxID=1314787 RepID=A0A9P4LX38_9PEZI|nr:hypothetical protein K490DRAFT_66073 [Saccharata proteae CBS 121410]
MVTYRAPSASPSLSDADANHKSQRASLKRPRLNPFSEDSNAPSNATDPMSVLANRHPTYLSLDTAKRPKISVPDPDAPSYYRFESPPPSPPAQPPPCKYGFFDLPKNAREKIFTYLLAPEAKNKIYKHDAGLGQTDRFIETNIYCGVPIEDPLDTSRADKYLRLRSDTAPEVSVSILRTGSRVHAEAFPVLYSTRHFRFVGKWIRDGEVVERLEERTMECEIPLLMRRQWLVMQEWLLGLTERTRSSVRSMGVWLQPAYRGSLITGGWNGGFKNMIVDGMQGRLDLEYLVLSESMPKNLVHLGVEVWTGPWWFGLADREGRYFDGKDMRNDEGRMGNREQKMYRLHEVTRALENVEVELHVDAVRQGGVDRLSTGWMDRGMMSERRQVCFDTTFVAEGAGRMLFPYRLNWQMREERRLLLLDNSTTGMTPEPDWATKLDEQTTTQRNEDISGIQTLGFTDYFNTKFSEQGPLDEDVLASEEEARVQANLKEEARRRALVEKSLDACKPKARESESQAVVPRKKSPESVFEREINSTVLKVVRSGSDSEAETERFEAWMGEMSDQ